MEKRISKKRESIYILIVAAKGRCDRRDGRYHESRGFAGGILQDVRGLGMEP